MTDSFDLIRMADPASSDVEVPTRVMARGDLLTLIDEKVTPMSVDTETRPAKTKARRPAIVVAIAAFAIVLVAGALFIVLAQSNTEVPPAEDTPPTTTLTGQAAEDAANAEKFAEVYSTGDMSAVLAAYQESGGFNERAFSNSDIGRYIEFRLALGETMTITSCEEATPRGVRCIAELANELTDGLVVASSGVPLQQNPKLHFTFGSNNGKVTNMNSFPTVSSWALVRNMSKWIQEEKPEIAAQLADGGSCDPNRHFDCVSGSPSWRATAETAAILLELRAEFLAQTDLYTTSE